MPARDWPNVGAPAEGRGCDELGVEQSDEIICGVSQTFLRIDVHEVSGCVAIVDVGRFPVSTPTVKPKP
jgi:hypothetical protein